MVATVVPKDRIDLVSAPAEFARGAFYTAGVGFYVAVCLQD